MTDRLDLAALLADPAAVVDVPAADVPALLVRLAALQTALAAVLATPPAPLEAPDELITDVAEVARIVHRSVSWVQKKGHTLPGFSQPGLKRTKRTWSRRALEAWVSGSG